MLLALLTLWFGIIWDKCYADVIIAPFFRRGNWVVVLIYTVLTALVYKAYHCTRFGYLKRSDLIYYQAIGICFVNFITYFQISVIGRDFMAVTPILILTAMDLVTIIGMAMLISKIYFRLYPPRRLVIVFGSKKAADLVMKMSSRIDKYMICESVNCDDGLERITSQLSAFDGAILCDIPAELRSTLLEYCCGNRIRTYTVPEISDILMRGGDEIRLFDTPLILCRNEGLSPERRFTKRTFDILVSAILLLVLSPFLAIIAAAVHAEDKGPVFYRQKRLTRDGKIFEVLKFRSMIPDAEADGIPVLASDHDDRITRTGRILRHFRLDELPQLINILKGEMSLVGPRPERPELAEEYAKDYPEFSYRLQVKAGLTGYAQVTGTYDTEPIDKLKMDLMYIENYSFVLDLQILLMTIKIALFPPETNSEERSALSGSHNKHRKE